jgi:hypothetical protein
VPLGVDDAGLVQGVEQRLEVAVDVADDIERAEPLPLRGRGRSRGGLTVMRVARRWEECRTISSVGIICPERLSCGGAIPSMASISRFTTVVPMRCGLSDSVVIGGSVVA